MVVVQIAGLIARRIICDLQPGDRVEIGDTYGLIRFGPGWTPTCPPGRKS